MASEISPIQKQKTRVLNPPSRGIGSSCQGRSLASQAGITLIEILVVVAVVAGLYSVVAPSFSFQRNAAITTYTDQIAQDVRAAFDLALLRALPYRLVFHLPTGDYWLEEPDIASEALASQLQFVPPPEDVPREQQEDQEALFDSRFEKYVALAGAPAKDPVSGDELKPSTPVLAARARLLPMRWYPVKSLGWGKRSPEGALIITDMAAEHHLKPVVSPEERDEEVIGAIYFFPNGYVEKAYIHLAGPRYGERVEADPDGRRLTIVTKPLLGTAEISDGTLEVSLKEDTESRL